MVLAPALRRPYAMRSQLSWGVRRRPRFEGGPALGPLPSQRPVKHVCGAVGLALTLACSPPDGQGLSDRIAMEVRRGSGTTIDLRALAPFRWSRFYVIRPYSQKVDVEQV